MSKIEKNVFTLKTDDGLRDYDLTNLGTFGMLRRLESHGVNVMALANGDSNGVGLISTLISIFAVMINVDDDTASMLMDEHVRNGGDIGDIMTAFQNVMEGAGFGKSPTA